jgi:periplasmic divalent cation tolerance protein
VRQPCELILTAPETSDLDGLIRQLIERRLCAAGHRDTIATTYRWRGEIHAGVEIKAVLHTCTDRIAELETAITAWHPYEVPCIAHRDLHASTAYAQWIRDQTRP